MAHEHTPSLSELHEFRTAIALARAAYAGDMAQVKLLTQLIETPEEHVTAMRALIQCLLMELDTQKRDANEMLTFLVESAATADAHR